MHGMSLLSSFLPILYVQISPERLTLRNARTGDATPRWGSSC